ncbi:hypothetical protein RND61_07175 [Streptomyces sp. TRM76323]|uniref:Uncharacterized protein n=1 Tax=Streptomyces tamarix TaxID=3078565 RepID=A0ABU3QGH0_9ACTN|nr:hypothetical protein [Streptomyces tamarix]MDT9681855.1 hypothetical protein [Streptomyces tamarix]
MIVEATVGAYGEAEQRKSLSPTSMDRTTGASLSYFGERAYQ